MMLGKSCLVFLSGCVIWSGRAAAQAPALVKLDRHDAEYATGFTQITSVRALSDGRVLVVDGQERSVQLLNSAFTSATPVGRNGAGPGEYAVPRRLHVFRADTTLLHDPGNGRYLLILPAGQVGATITLNTDGLSSIVAERGADRDHRFYYQVRKGRAQFGESAAEEWLVRLTVANSRLDTLARLTVPAGREEGTQTVGPGLIRRLTNRPLAAEDIAVVGSDGWVAIVRTQPYRVEWLPPAGAAVSGPTIPYSEIRVTPAERRASLDAQVVPGQIIVRNTGGRAMPLPPSARRGRSEQPTPPGFDEASLKWPAHKPPFLAGAVQIAADGRLWVLRTAPMDDSIPHYDVFDRTGHLVLRVDLPARTRLAGFGAGLIFLVRTDDDDLQYLRRYRFRN